jgi:selenocysteine-specific elongation factor
LVVAADDGVMPQTREHVLILALLGITHGAVAITKIDRVDESRVAAVRGEVQALLGTTTLHNAAIFPVNAVLEHDAGVAALRQHLHAAAAQWPQRSGQGLFRLAVDRVFTLAGQGTIVTGTVRSGSVRVGDSLVVMPRGTQVRVRSIHAHNRPADEGRAGQRCALNLVGIDKAGISRGDWLADPRALTPTRRMDVRMRRLGEGLPLHNRGALHVHVGTADRVATLALIDDPSAAGASFRAQLVFDSPMCAAAGDSFILRDAQAQHTVGGGRIIDPGAPGRHRRSAARLARLEGIERWLDGEGLVPLLTSAPEGLRICELVRLSGRPADEIVWSADTRVVDTPGESWILLENHFRALLERAVTTLREFHRQEPDERGIDRGRWRRMTMPALADAVWRVAVDELVQRGVVLGGGHGFHLPQHRVDLTLQEERMAETLLPALARGGFDPPWVRDLAASTTIPEAEVRALLRKCVMQGAAWQIVHDLFFHRDRVQELAALFEALAERYGVVDAVRYRDALGVGRKRSIQILEFFDRVGYTRRLRAGRVRRVDSSWRTDL